MLVPNRALLWFGIGPRFKPALKAKHSADLRGPSGGALTNASLCHIMTETFFMAYCAYILYSPSSGKYYVGQTHDIDQRMCFHNEISESGYTTRYRPWNLECTLEVETRATAMKIERYLKKKPRSFLVRVSEDAELREYIINKMAG